jgi:uroporphyrinogen decarboxylase
MNGREKPLLAVLNGTPVWPPPIWLMRQAGRYLPEYRAIRAEVPDFIALCMDPVRASEVTLQPIRRFGFDAAILFSDILVLPWALGHGLAFKEGEGPVLPKLRDSAAVKALNPTRVADAVAPVLETIRRVRTGLAAEGHDQTALIGFAGAPFTVACYMVEGGGSRDFAATRAMAYADPALFGALMDVLVEATVTYLDAQANAGAEALMLFDSWAGVLAPVPFRLHVIEATRRIVSKLKILHPRIPIIGFPRLAGMMLGEYASATGVDAVGMDTGMDPMRAATLAGDEVAVQGNLDPMSLVAGGSALRQEAATILTGMRGRRLIFNLGHGIVPQTPPAHVAALVEQIRAA